MRYFIMALKAKDGALDDTRIMMELEKSQTEPYLLVDHQKPNKKDSPYYRKRLNKDIRKQLDSYIKDNANIVVGDAPGIDRQVQDYLNMKVYKNVEVYGPGKEVRYSANKKWKTNPIDSDYEPGSSKWLAVKDIKMSEVATEGFAVILDEGSEATRNNISRMESANKKVKVYELSRNGKKYDHFNN